LFQLYDMRRKGDDGVFPGRQVSAPPESSPEVASSSPPLDAPHAEALLAQAAGDLQRGSIPAVLDACNLVLADFPANAAAWHLLAQARLAGGDLVQAQYNADRAIQHDPARPEPYYVRGRILAQEQHFDRSVADLDRAIHLQPAERRYYF